jgi:U3 small nucleolar RNA-associated protein 20
LVSGSLQLKISGSQSDSLLRNVSDIIESLTEICIENITWKKANGFLHLIEEIFGTFDMSHISPFLNVLLIIVVRLLESCMHSLRKESDQYYHCKQSDDRYNDCSMNLDMDNNSSRMEKCPKEMPVADHMEVCNIITLLGDLSDLMYYYISCLFGRVMKQLCRLFSGHENSWADPCCGNIVLCSEIIVG